MLGLKLNHVSKRGHCCYDSPHLDTTLNKCPEHWSRGGDCTERPVVGALFLRYSFYDVHSHSPWIRANSKKLSQLPHPFYCVYVWTISVTPNPTFHMIYNKHFLQRDGKLVLFWKNVYINSCKNKLLWTPRYLSLDLWTQSSIASTQLR